MEKNANANQTNPLTAFWSSRLSRHYDYGGKAPQRASMKHPSMAPYGGYLTKEGEMVVIAIQNNREWTRFCEGLLEWPDMVNDPRFQTNNARVANRIEMDEVINSMFSQYTRPDLENKLNETGIAYGAVNSVANLSNHPQLSRKPMIVNDEMVQMVASPIVTEFDSDEFGIVPELGEHTNKVRQEFSG